MRYRARVVQHRTMDFVVEADTPGEASWLAEEQAAECQEWHWAVPVYECASLHKEEDK